MLMNSRTPRWEELRASPRIPVNDILSQLDVAAVCKLLERPVPADTGEALRWLTDEALVDPEGDGGYSTTSVRWPLRGI